MGSSSKGGGSTSELKDYYASFAGIAGWGPAHALVALEIDGVEVWRPGSPVLESASSNPYQFDITDYGRVYFYWGTDDQSLSDGVLNDTGRDHPPYRRRVLVVFKDFLCGRERDAVPDIKVIYQRKPQQTVITGDAADLDSDGQANPLAALAEIITNDITGLGRPDSLLDFTTWQAIADDLHTDETQEYLGIKLAKDISTRAILDALNGYCDLWFRLNDSGKIEVGRFDKDSIVPGNLTKISQDDLVDTPSIQNRGNKNVDNRTELTFKNRDKGFENDKVRYDSPTVRELSGQDNIAQVRRDWIHRADQATVKVAEIGGREAENRGSLSARIRASALLSPGTLFLFDYGLLSYQRVFRLIRSQGESDAGGPVTIQAESEGSVLDYPEEDPDEVTLEEDTLSDLDYWHVIQAPSELVDGLTYRLIALAGQDQGFTRGFNVYFQDQAADYQFLGTQLTWAVPVKLAAAYADTEATDDTTGNLKITQYSPAPLNFDDLVTDPTDDEIADDTHLLIIIDPADFTSFEILTVQSIEDPTSGEYPVHVLRARFGTSKGDWSTDDPAYFINRSALRFFYHQALPDMAANSRSASLKLQPFSSYDVFSLASITAKTLDIIEIGPDTPTGLSSEWLDDPNISLFVTWNANSESNIALYELERKNQTDGGSFETVFSGLATSCVVKDFILEKDWKFRLRAKDTDGNYSPYTSEITVTTMTS